MSERESKTEIYFQQQNFKPVRHRTNTILSEKKSAKKNTLDNLTNDKITYNKYLVSKCYIYGERERYRETEKARDGERKKEREREIW